MTWNGDEGVACSRAFPESDKGTGGRDVVKAVPVDEVCAAAKAIVQETAVVAVASSSGALKAMGTSSAGCVQIAAH